METRQSCGFTVEGNTDDEDRKFVMSAVQRKGDFVERANIKLED